MVYREMAAGTRGAYWNHSTRGGPAHASCPHASSFFCGRRSAAWSGGNFQRERRAPGRGGVPPKGGERSPEGGEVPPEGASLRRASAARSCVFQPAVLGQLGWEGARSAPSRCGCGFSHCLCACVSRLVFVFARLGKMALALWRFGLATGGRLWSQGVYLCGCRDVFGVVLGVVCDGACGDLVWVPSLFLFDLRGSYSCGQVSGRAVRQWQWKRGEYHVCYNHEQMAWYVHKMIGSLARMYGGIRVV